MDPRLGAAGAALQALAMLEQQCAELHQFLELGLLLGQIERGAGSRGMDRATR